MTQLSPTTGNAAGAPGAAASAIRPKLTGRDAPDYGNILACIRCGLCLSVCPTYATDHVEMDSPRGRVALIRAVDEGRLPLLSEGLYEHLYNCLDCRACQTACPSGVKVGELVLAARAEVEQARRQSFGERVVKWVALERALTSSRSLARYTWALRLYQRLGVQRSVRATRLLERLPGKLKTLATMEALLPTLPSRPLHAELPEVTPARGERKRRVGFFLGCMMSVILADTSRATVRVLAENGCEVVTPKDQVCCGAPHVEEGDTKSQRELARRNVDVFSRYGDLDFVVTDCAACGAEIKKYGRLLADEPAYAEKARGFSARVREISELLAEIPLRKPGAALPTRVTYHEPCHLCHAQGIKQQPRQVIQSIPGVKLVEMKESDWCCGSAGVYNITHAERAGKLLDRKIENIQATEPDVILTGNPGCLLQLQAGMRKSGAKTRVLHPIELLDRAYQLERTRGSGQTDESERAGESGPKGGTR